MTALRARVSPADVVDVFVYVVVLNLAAEYAPSVISETFTVSLLTAVLLKVVLEAVVVVKGRVKGRLRAAATPAGKVAAAGLLWLVLVGSKFVVLTLEDLIFGDAVSLGGFVSVTLLIVVLLLARAGVRRLLAPYPRPQDTVTGSVTGSVTGPVTGSVTGTGTGTDTGRDA